MNAIEAYPLCYPAGWERSKYRTRSKFKDTIFTRSRDQLLHQIRLLGGSDIILSTNIPLRQDGLPYGKYAMPADPGVAVYFKLKKKSMSFACDKWDRVEHNIHSILLTIEAIRGIERWGASDMMERAFTGFAQIEPPKNDAWFVVLGVPESATKDEITKAFREKLVTTHPDRGGSHDAMAKLNEAYGIAMRGSL